MVVLLRGGLGNQMFGYAFGRSLSLARREPLFFTREYLDNWDTKRCFALGVFGIPMHFLEKLTVPIYRESPWSFNPQVYTVPDGMLFDGYWQTERYFDAAKVRKIFSPQGMGEESRKVAGEIASLGGHSAFLHVRRTDYMDDSNPDDPLRLGMDYYREALAMVRERDGDAKFFVFSDDPDWCRQAFPELRTVGHNKSGGRLFGSEASGKEHEDLWLMSLCRHAVIANSSFSWWGAWLGDSQPDRLVVAPRQWVKPERNLDTRDVVPERWERC